MGNSEIYVFTFLSGARLSRVVSEDVYYQCVGTLLEQVDDGVIKGILVLLQPTGNVIWYLGSINFYQTASTMS